MHYRCVEAHDCPGPSFSSGFLCVLQVFDPGIQTDHWIQAPAPAPGLGHIRHAYDKIQQILLFWSHSRVRHGAWFGRFSILWQQPRSNVQVLLRTWSSLPKSVLSRLSTTPCTNPCLCFRHKMLSLKNVQFLFGTFWSKFHQNKAKNGEVINFWANACVEVVRDDALCDMNQNTSCFSLD